MALAACPPPGTATPASISAWADEHDYRVERLVWRSGRGDVTALLVRDGHPRLYAKASDHGLLDEAERLSWLHGRFASPAMADFVAGDESLIVTHALDGESATSSRWRTAPATAARAIGEGLARLHSLDPSSCLFDAPEWLSDDIGDELVILHGDPCAPNTIVAPDGSFAGIVDVGQLGPGDPWADLAIASWSLDWNFGPGHARHLFDAYGVTPDEDRIAHYRRLWGPPPL